jgi:O-antigen/teichoic acid export membrane protein
MLFARVGVGGVALLDQVLFASASFATSILLARWLAPAEFGAFSLAFFVFLLVGALHTSVLTEPMLVLGAGRYSAGFRRYLGLLLVGHALVCVPLGGALGLAALVLWGAGSPPAAWAMLGLAAASPALLLLWLVRRAFYVSLRPGWAAIGDGIYLVAVVAGLAALAEWSSLTPARAFLTMGGAALVATALMLLRLRPTLRSGSGPTASAVAREHWAYGRWSLAAQGVYWTSGQALMVVVPAVLGLGAAAALSAAMNLFRPLNPLIQSLTSMLLPATSARAGETPIEELRAQTRRFATASAALMAAYGLCVWIFAEPILHHLYAGRYDGAAKLVLLIALANVAATVVQVQTVLLKATGHVRAVPMVWGASAVVVLALTAPALALFGLRAGLAVVLLSYVLAGLLAWRRTGRIEVAA